MNVVDPGGGPGKAAHQAAIDAGAPGDIVLLRDGDDTSTPLWPLRVTGTALTLVADTGVAPPTLERMLVEDLVFVSARQRATITPSAPRWKLRTAGSASVSDVSGCVAQGWQSSS